MNLWRGGNFKTETYTANIKIKKNVSVSRLKLFKIVKKLREKTIIYLTKQNINDNRIFFNYRDCILIKGTTYII